MTLSSDIMAEAIENYLMEALEAVADLDEIRAWVRGGLPGGMMSQDMYPFCEVLVATEDEVEEMTGNYYGQSFLGLITFNKLMAGRQSGDRLRSLGGRLYEVPSYADVRALVHAAMGELQKATHHDLGGLTVGDEAVVAFRLTGPRVYGLDLDERANNWENFGSLPFEVETERRVSS